MTICHDTLHQLSRHLELLSNPRDLSRLILCLHALRAVQRLRASDIIDVEPVAEVRRRASVVLEDDISSSKLEQIAVGVRVLLVLVGTAGAINLVRADLVAHASVLGEAGVVALLGRVVAGGVRLGDEAVLPATDDWDAGSWAIDTGAGSTDLGWHRVLQVIRDDGGTTCIAL